MKKTYQDSLFYLVVFATSYFIYIYPFEILSDFILNEKVSRQNSFYSTLFVSFVVIYYFRSHNTFFLLKLFVHEGMGVGFISFWIINLALIISLTNFLNDYQLGITSLTIIIILSVYGLINARFFRIKKLSIRSSKIKRKYNFVFISDVHLGSNPDSSLRKIVNKINKTNYDFLLIGGDLIDSSSFDLKNLSILKSIKKPIFFVTGNHEHYIKNSKEKLGKLILYNITLLRNENFLFDDLNIIGIDDYQTPDNQTKTNIELENKSKFNLTLVHKSSIWHKIFDNTDLMLAGHTHNGQIFPFNLFVKIKFKYSFGLYRNKNSYLYVSSGSGCWGPRIRLGTSNEIVYIELSPNIN
jgi:hypothetical protein